MRRPSFAASSRCCCSACPASGRRRRLKSPCAPAWAWCPRSAISRPPSRRRPGTRSSSLRADPGHEREDQFRRAGGHRRRAALRRSTNWISRARWSRAPHTNFAQAGVGVAVKAGAPKPDISNVAAFKAAMLNAKSIGYSRGGSGSIAARVMEKLGIADRTQGANPVHRRPPGRRGRGQGPGRDRAAADQRHHSGRRRRLRRAAAARSCRKP